MMRRLLPRAARLAPLAGDERGTSVIEFAFVAPILSLLTMGIIDISSGYSRRLELTQAASRTLERLATNNFEIPEDAEGNPDFTALRAEAALAAGVPVDQIEAIRWLECDGVEQPAENFAAGCPPNTSETGCDVSDPPGHCYPVTARYVQVRIDDSFAPMFGTIFSAEADGTYPLWAEAAVRVQ